MTYHPSPIYGKPCANKWGAGKNFLYKFLKTQNVTDTMFDVLSMNHSNYIKMLMNPNY